MTHYEFIAPRNPLKVSPVLYPWSSIDQIYYSQIFKDEVFYEIVEQSIHDEFSLVELLKGIDKIKVSVEKLTNSNLPKILKRSCYDEVIDEEVRENLSEWITLLAKVTKMVAFDALCFLLKPSVFVVEELPITSEQTDYVSMFYDRVRPAVEVHCRKAIAYFIEQHAQLGEVDGTEYTLDQTSDGISIIKLFVKTILKELLTCLMDNDSFEDEKAPVSGIENAIVGIVDIEMGLMSRMDLDEEESAELVLARVNHVLSIFGSPKIDYCADFVKQLAKLAYGAKATNFGLIKRDVVGTGGSTGEKILGKKIHRASNKDKMLMSSSAGQHLLQKKASERQLVEKKRVSQEYATGGEVFLLLDATGSTMPSSLGYGVINLEEAIAVAMAQCCRENQKKLTVYFYNEGTVKIESFSPTEPEKTFKLKKLNLFGNAGYRNNDELTTFQEVFYEISRKPGKKHSIIFISDGGVMSGADRNQVEQLKALFALYSHIEVLPILISYYIDATFQRLFDGYKMIHVKDIEGFDVSKLDECIKIVQSDSKSE